MDKINFTLRSFALKRFFNNSPYYRYKLGFNCQDRAPIICFKCGGKTQDYVIHETDDMGVTEAEAKCLGCSTSLGYWSHGVWL